MGAAGGGGIGFGGSLDGPSKGDDILGLLAAAAAAPLLLFSVFTPRMTLMGISLTFSLIVSRLKGEEDAVSPDAVDEAAGLPAAEISGDIRADPTFMGEEERPKAEPKRSPKRSANRSPKGEPARPPPVPPRPPPPEKMEGMEGI